MLNITVDKIAAFNPCESRFGNFKQQYPDFRGSVEEFISLDNITYSYKVWVCVRMMSQNQRFYWARACALSVLEIFEANRPDDKRVRELLEFLATITDVTKLTDADRTDLSTLRSAAYAAAAAAYADRADARQAQEELNLILLNQIMEMDI